MFNPRHPSLNGTRQLLRWKMAIVKQLTLFSVVCLLMNFTEYRMRRLPRKLGRFLRLPMRVPRKSRTQSFKFLTPNLKSSRWVMTSHLIHSMGSSIIIIAKLNLGEKIEDAKVVRKILRSYQRAFVQRSQLQKRAKIWMRSRSKNSLDLSKHMSLDCLSTSRANHLLSKPSTREWMTPLKKMMWRRR